MRKTARRSLCGSHIDTVRTGGRYDGNLGVLAGLEIIETLNDAGLTTRRPLAVAFFSNEEGARIAPDMMGSLVYVGGLPLAEAHAAVSIDGKTVADELERIGYRGDAPVPGATPYAFVELHIEQGPILEAEGIGLGAVTGVQGISWTEVTVEGQANHAGTTPMSYRHDAGYVAAETAAFVRRLVKEMGGAQVGTVGAIDLDPNLVNVVARKAVLTVDLRNTDESLLQQAEARLNQHLDTIAEAEGVETTTRKLARFEPVDFDLRVIELVEDTAKSPREVPTSGAALLRAGPRKLSSVARVRWHNRRGHLQRSALAGNVSRDGSSRRGAHSHWLQHANSLRA